MPLSTQQQQFLKQTAMFRGLSDDLLEAVASIAIWRKYDKGEWLFTEGDEGNGFFIVASGRIKVFKESAEGKEQILHIFAVGEHFAEIPAFDGQPFPASAEAIEKSEVVFFPRTQFLKLIEQYPKLAIGLLVVCARHLRRLAGIIENLSFKEVPERLAAYLLYLSQRAGNANEVELDLTKAQLAALLGTIPETLSRVFSKLSQEGLIALNGSAITLLDRQALIRRAKMGSIEEN